MLKRALHYYRESTIDRFLSSGLTSGWSRTRSRYTYLKASAILGRNGTKHPTCQTIRYGKPVLLAASQICYHSSAHAENTEQAFCLSGADQRDIFFPKRQNPKKRLHIMFLCPLALRACQLTLTRDTKT